MTMTKKKRSKKKAHEFPKELLDALLSEGHAPEDILGKDGLLKRLTAALVTRVMETEMEHHLNYESGDTPPESQSNRRNGTTPKTLRTDRGPIEITVPRDRESSFEPQIVPKHQRHFDGFDDKIVSMYARGMSVRDIQAHLEEIYGVDVSPALVSKATDAVIGELKLWQQRPLESTYFVVYLDALVVKIRDQSGVRNKSVYLVVGVGADGHKDVLGMWVQQSEGAKFWLSILEELKLRGVEDIFILCADGLTGLPQAVEAAFPKAIFQTCIVHMIRNSTRFVPWKQRKAVCKDLRAIYTAFDAEAALEALEAFETKWGAQFPLVARTWRRRWDEVTPFLAFPAEIRRVIYTTNAIEALNRQIRKVLKTRGHMPSDQAAMKLIYLAIYNAKKRWGHRARSWAMALQQFAILFEERLPKTL